MVIDCAYLCLHVLPSAGTSISGRSARSLPLLRKLNGHYDTRDRATRLFRAVLRSAANSKALLLDFPLAQSLPARDVESEAESGNVAVSCCIIA
jgi:hypothetical protein